MLVRHRFRVGSQQPVESGRSDEEQHGSRHAERAGVTFDEPHRDLRSDEGIGEADGSDGDVTDAATLDVPLIVVIR